MSIKKLLYFIITVILFSNINSVHATEVKPPTGSQIEMCTLTFRVGYIPSGDKPFSEDIKVTLDDIATDKQYSFILKADKAYNASETYSIVANTTYNVVLEYPDSDRFKVVNADGSEISAYHATQSGLIISWQIIENARNSMDNNSVNQVSNAASVLKPGYAEDVVNNFYDNTEFIADDPNFKSFLDIYAGAAYKNLFLKKDGNTEDLWNSMSNYERASYSLLSSYPRQCILGVNRDLFASSKGVYIKNLDSPRNLLKSIPDGEKVYNEIVIVWEWHWSNWDEKNIFIDPYEGNIVRSISEDLMEESLYGAIFENPSVKDKDTNPEGIEESSTWVNRYGLFKALKNNVISVVIIIAVAIALGVITYRKKKTNFEDIEEG